MRARSDEAVPTRGLLLQLVSIGLVAVSTIILFSIASFSFFANRPQMLPSTSSGYSLSSHAGANAGMVPADRTSPGAISESSQAHDANAAIQEPPKAATEGAAISAVDTSQANGSQSLAAVPLSLADETSGPVETSARAIPAKPTEMQQDQSAQRDQPGVVPDSNMPEQGTQNRRGSGYPRSSQADFQYRVKKECGPIINDPVLYRHCVSTFGVRYR
jgi:hypothetical protein